MYKRGQQSLDILRRDDVAYADKILGENSDDIERRFARAKQHARRVLHVDAWSIRRWHFD